MQPSYCSGTASNRKGLTSTAGRSARAITRTRTFRPSGCPRRSAANAGQARRSRSPRAAATMIESRAVPARLSNPAIGPADAAQHPHHAWRPEHPQRPTVRFGAHVVAQPASAAQPAPDPTPALPHYAYRPSVPERAPPARCSGPNAGAPALRGYRATTCSPASAGPRAASAAA